MQEKLKEQWIEALLSGKYDQGFASLAQLYDPSTSERFEEPRYCCLGVLCEVAEVDYRPGDGIPDAHWMQEIGLEFILAEKLASLNDTGRSFAAIAKKIKEDA